MMTRGINNLLEYSTLPKSVLLIYSGALLPLWLSWPWLSFIQRRSPPVELPWCSFLFLSPRTSVLPRLLPSFPSLIS